MDVIGAVDIGGTKMAVGLVSPQGQVLASEVFPSQTGLEYLRGMQQIADALHCHLAQTGGCLLGIGIGCTGQMNPAEGRIVNNGFLPGWSGQRPVSWLSEQFSTRVALENDADAAALAEWRLGAGQGANRFIYLTISTGIGAGLIFDGQIYRGAMGQHPEMGHQTIDPCGPACFCGSRGCWETFASGRALEHRFQVLKPGFSGDARQVCDLAETGDAQALEAVMAHGEALGIGLANLITLLAPDVIALGGGLMQRASLFLDSIQAAIQHYCRLVNPHSTRLVLSRLGDQTGLVGAALVWQQRFANGQI